MTLYELHETATLPGWNFDIGDLAEPLEERTKLILGDIAREPANKNSGVIRVGELVHRLLLAIVADRWVSHIVDTTHTWVRPNGSASRHAAHATRWSSASLVLWRCSGDAHRSIAAVYTLHLLKCALLVTFVRKADKAIAARHSTNWVCHDFRGFAGGKAVLEKGNQDVFVDFGAKVADEYGVLWSALISTTICQYQSYIANLWTYLRSASPPPEAQFNLKGRLEFGMMVPFNVNAFAAAAGLWKSIKQ